MERKVYECILKRGHYVKTHNDLSANIFSKYFLDTNEIIQFFSMVDSIRKEIIIPSGCNLEGLLKWNDSCLERSSCEIEKYVFELSKEIIQECNQMHKIPNKMSEALKAEVTSIQRVMFYEFQENRAFCNLMEIRRFLIFYIGTHSCEKTLQDEDSIYLNLKPNG